ncbi:hypothetical protein LTR85_005870 [Meristemomyces frigidus]|nr:hypothetical protein LTR85_005870 [Meristemomyces frigidus]
MSSLLVTGFDITSGQHLSNVKAQISEAVPVPASDMSVQAPSEHLDSGRSGRSTAPIHSVPQERIVSIEHPCVVKNFNNGFKSLGGEPQLKHVLDHQVGDSLLRVDGKSHVFPEPVAGVSLRPHDPLAKKLASKGLDTHNVLIKVTLPRWTGRKRKRGSNDPFTTPSPPEPQDTSIKAPELLRRMRDAEGTYTIEPVGMIQETHRFRSQPDFQMRTDNLPIITALREHAMNPSYDALKKLRVDLRPGLEGVTAFPLPPNLVPMDQPYRYEYQQATNVTFRTDDLGNTTSESRVGMRKRQVSSLAADARDVPQGPPADLKRSNMGEDTLLKGVEQIRALLDKRPMVTRRVALSALPDLKEAVWTEASDRVGYLFKNGPFRDILIRYGVDPRSDPKYRLYQMLTFNLDRRLKASGAARSKAEDRGSYVFDGTAANAKIKTYQVCDITDPLLYEQLRTDNIRAECDVHQWGWYHSGTIAKARVIMRDKTACFATGQTTSDDEYRAILTLPDEFTEDKADSTRLDPNIYSAKVIQLSREYRTLARYHAGLQRPPRGTAGSPVSDVNALYGDAEADEQYSGDDNDIEASGLYERTWDGLGGGDGWSESGGVD